MFASKTPRDLSHDPEPFQQRWPGLRRSSRPASDWPRNPRPEFDHLQHNEPNRILVAYRAHLATHRLTEDADAWVLALGSLDAFGGFVGWDATTDRYHALTLATDEEAAHALRVLERLRGMR